MIAMNRNTKTAAKPAPETLLARDIMRTKMVTIEESAPLSEVERILSESRVSGAPVVDVHGGIVGVISIRDLIERYAEEPSSRPRRGRGTFWLATDELDEEEFESFEAPEESEETAGQVMTAAVHTIDANATLVEVARTMVELQIHRILVTEKRRTMGLISTMDILRAISGVVKKGRPRATKRKAAAKR